MTSKQKDLIYIYDSDRQKVIMIDSETGERVNEKDDEVTSLLKYLYEQNRSVLLRKFAVWCTRQVNDDLKPIQKKILDLAEEAISQRASTKELQELYQETEGAAIATDSVGLRQGEESAPAYLAARECINPDPLEGAIQAARFHRIWTEIKLNKDGTSALKEIKTKTEKDEISQVKQQQTDFLLDLMNE
jgi:hypothetical protein